MSKPPSPARRARLARRLQALSAAQAQRARRRSWRDGALALVGFALMLLGALRPLLLARPLFGPLLALSVLVAAWLWWRLGGALGLGDLLRARAWASSERLGSLLHLGLAALLGSLTLLGTTLALMGGVPAALHGLWAQPAELEVRVERLQRRPGTRGCAYGATLNSPTHVAPLMPCSLARDLTLRGLDHGPVRLAGSQSWLGFRYQALAAYGRDTFAP